MSLDPLAPMKSNEAEPIPKRKPNLGTRHRLAIRSVSILSLLCLLVYLTVSVISAHILTLPRSRPITLQPGWISARSENWSVVCEDGVRIQGWYCPVEQPEMRPLIVLVHGLGENRQNVAGQAKGLVDRGYNVLLFDLRGHGESDAELRISLGRRERRDLRAVLKWALAKGYETDEIGWVGYSMGGATLIMEAASNRSIRTVAVDSAFGDLPAILESQLSIESGLPALFNPGILLAAGWLFDSPVADLVPAESARKWGHRPLLVIHGVQDSLVPKRQAEAIAKAAGQECQVVYLPQVGHCEAFKSDPKGYIDRLDRFFGEHLGR